MSVGSSPFKWCCFEHLLNLKSENKRTAEVRRWFIEMLLDDLSTVWYYVGTGLQFFQAGGWKSCDIEWTSLQKSEILYVGPVWNIRSSLLINVETDSARVKSASGRSRCVPMPSGWVPRKSAFGSIRVKAFMGRFPRLGRVSHFNHVPHSSKSKWKGRISRYVMGSSFWKSLTLVRLWGYSIMSIISVFLKKHPKTGCSTLVWSVGSSMYS